MSVLSRMASDKYDELKHKYLELKYECDSYQLALKSLTHHLMVEHRAMYLMASDLLSIKYPNVASEDIDEFIESYYKEAEKRIEEEDNERT